MPRQRNQGQWDFFIDDESELGFIMVTIRVPRYMDTSLIDVDVHPLWFQASIKGRLILLHLPHEVIVNECKVQRITSTGALVLKLLRVDHHRIQARSKASKAKSKTEAKSVDPLPKSQGEKTRNTISSSEWNQLTKPVGEKESTPLLQVQSPQVTSGETSAPVDRDFDESEVPPLE